MIAAYNKRSFVFGIPGLVLQTAGWIGLNLSDSSGSEPGLSVALWAGALLVGTGLLLLGLGFYAASKGRSPAWCALGLLGIIGFIVLACLTDLAGDKAGAPVVKGQMLARVSVYLAIVGLIPILGAPFGVAAIVTGTIAIARVKRSPDLGGSGAAWTGIVLAGATLIVWTALVIVAIATAARHDSRLNSARTRPTGAQQAPASPDPSR